MSNCNYIFFTNKKQEDKAVNMGNNQLGELDTSKMEHLVEDLTEKYEALSSLGLLPENIASYYQTFMM